MDCYNKLCYTKEDKRKMKNIMSISDFIQLIIACVTFIAVIVALFANRFWEWLDRPHISVYFNDENTENYHQTSMELRNGAGQLIESIPTYYVRLKITNLGKRTLENTEVILEKVEPQPNVFMSLNLSWAGQVADGTGIARIVRIPQEQSRIIDVLEVMEPTQTLNFIKNLSNNDPSIKRYEKYSKGFRSCSIRPNTLSDIFTAGTYIFHLGIYADNTEPKLVKLSIKYDGNWGTQGIKGMRKKHLRIKLVDNG